MAVGSRRPSGRRATSASLETWEQGAVRCQPSSATTKQLASGKTLASISLALLSKSAAVSRRPVSFTRFVTIILILVASPLSGGREDFGKIVIRWKLIGAGIGGVRPPKGIPRPHEQHAGLPRKLPQGRDAGDSRVPQISEAVISRNRDESLRNPARSNRRVRSKYLVFHSNALLTPSPRPNS